MKRKSEQKHFTSRSLKTGSEKRAQKTSLKTKGETESGKPTHSSLKRERERREEKRDNRNLSNSSLKTDWEVS